MSTVEVKKSWLEIDGEPTVIFGGDLAYSRIPRYRWCERVMQMKTARLNTVTFYIPWGYHQPSADVFDFEGDKDVAAFLGTIRDCGMYCVFRMGPFVHGEFKNGGLPQWLRDELGPRARTNDPAYLEYAKKWYNALLEIAKPFLHTLTGGPIILLQLENELGSAGCKGDDLPRGSTDVNENRKHLEFFVRLVRDAGFDLPLIDINKVPGKEEFLAPSIDTSGSYITNCFYSDGELYDFSTAKWERHTKPCVSIETGGGMFVRYYDVPPYRNTNSFQGPIVKPEIIESTVQQEFAQGSAGVCLYIFADGQNLEYNGESMLPLCNMNYQAPITEVGRLRPTYYALKRTGWMLRAWGKYFLPSEPNADWAKVRSCGIAHPGVRDSGDLFAKYGAVREEDAGEYQPTSLPALARTTEGLNLSETNFLFMRNVSAFATTWKRDIRALISPSRLASEVWQEYPKYTQFELPPQTNYVMTFFLRLRPRNFLEYSTAEVMDLRAFGDKTMLILSAPDEIMTETRVIVPDASRFKCSDSAVMVRTESPNTLLIVAKPARQPICVETDELKIVLVSRAYAERLWDVGDEAVWSMSPLSGTRETVQMISETADIRLEWFTHNPPRLRGGLIEAVETYDKERGVYCVNGRLPYPAFNLEWIRSYENGDIVLIANLPEALPEGADDVILTAHCDATIGHAFANGELVSDHAYGKFLTWEISLRKVLGRAKSLSLRCINATYCDVSLNVRVINTIEFQ